MEWNYQLVTRLGAGSLTLAHFWAREDMEDTLIRWMHRIISAQKSFRVTLQTPAEESVVRISDRQPLQQLAKELKIVDDYVRSYGCPDMKLITNPSFPAGTCDALPASFEVTELVLVRRKHAFDANRQVNVFGLRPV